MSSENAPVLLFGETYHHPNIYYRSGFLAPDPVVLIDRGGEDTVLWTSRLEEGRARKEARVGRVRCIEELDWSVGYPLAVTMMVAIDALLYWRFKRAHWV